MSSAYKPCKQFRPRWIQTIINLDPNWCYIGTTYGIPKLIFIEKFILKKISRPPKSHEKYPAIKEKIQLSHIESFLTYSLIQ